MRKVFRCVCCGRRAHKYSDANKINGGYLCEICALAYRLGVEDGKKVRLKYADELEEKVDRLSNHVENCKTDVSRIVTHLYLSDDGFKARWDKHKRL